VFHRLPVVVERLDDLIQRYGLPAPTHIKSDTDGHEGSVLAGAERTLAGVQGLILEMPDATEAAVLERLKAHGLERTQRYAERDGSPLIGFSYGLFSRGA
jgi:hypothetical protein